MLHQSCLPISPDFPPPLPNEQFEEVVKSLEWLCDPCQQELSPECQICATKVPGQLFHCAKSAQIHLYCGFWFNEIDVDCQTGAVSGLADISKYLKGACQICAQDQGCKVTCCQKGCSAVMHPVCAKESHLHYKQVLQGMRAMFCR